MLPIESPAADNRASEVGPGQVLATLTSTNGTYPSSFNKVRLCQLFLRPKFV